MFSTFAVRSWSIPFFSLFFLVGCGGPTKPIAYLQGKVTLDGKPLTHGSVMIEPDGPKGQSANGEIDSSGFYRIVSSPSFPGVHPGSYRVIVQHNKKASYSTEETPELGIPERYTKLGESGFNVTVEANKTVTLNLELKSQ